MNGLKLGSVSLPYPIIAAPLAGVSDKAYRRVLKESGVPLVFTEMVSAKALAYKNPKSEELVAIAGEKHPIGMQLFGRDPGEIAEAGAYLESIGADVIDFNIGCPAPKIVKNQEGSALLKEPELAVSILDRLVRSVKVPVTLKVRMGFKEGEHDALPLIQGAAAVGIQGVFVHARYREQYYSGSADWSYIRKVKESVDIPVIGNGDVTDPLKAVALLEQTGCDGILIGRGFLGNPFLYQEIVGFMDTGVYRKTSVEERLMTALRQLDYAVEDKGEAIAVREMRKHFGWYLKGLRGSAIHRNALNKAMTQREMKAILESISTNS